MNKYILNEKKKTSYLKDWENYSKGDFTDLKSKSFHGLAYPGPKTLGPLNSVSKHVYPSLLRMMTLKMAV